MDVNTEIEKWYGELINVYGHAKSMTVLAKSMIHDFDATSNMADMQYMLIKGLYCTAALNICRIFDVGKDAGGIRQFRNTLYGEKAKKPKFQFDANAEKRLRDYRNKVLAHLDKVFLSIDLDKEFPLYLSDLESLLKSIEDELLPLAKNIVKASIAGINQETKEWYFPVVDRVEKEYTIFKNMLLTYRQMETYMKENHKCELLAIYKMGGQQ